MSSGMNLSIACFSEVSDNEQPSTDAKAEGRAYRYFPLVEMEAAGGSALSRILDKIFGGSAELLLSQLVSDRDISPSELTRMKKLLEGMEEEGDS